MPRPTMENVRSLDDYLVLYDWDISIVKPPVGAPVPPDFNFHAISATIPGASNELIEVNIRGHKVQQPGLITYNSIELTVQELNTAPVIKFISGWREAQWKTNTGYQEKRNDSSAELLMNLMNRQNEVVRTFKVKGCHLEDYNLGDAGGEGEAMQPSLTIKYDYFEES